MVVPLSQGNIIVISQDGKHKLIKTNKKTIKAQSKEILEKWAELSNNKEVKAIIWSGQSVDNIQLFVEFLIKKSSKKQLDELVKMKNLPKYLLENYKKYFNKYEFIGQKDYTFKQ